MSARIAPEPISTGLGAVADYRSRAASRDSGASAREQPQQQTEPPSPQQQAMQLPLPVPPPGAAFAVALISGQLPPKPTSERELIQRLGSADLPAQGSLALHDRLV